MTPKVLYVEENNRSGYNFVCDICGRKSALFSLQPSAKKEAEQHIKNRCPKEWAPHRPAILSFGGDEIDYSNQDDHHYQQGARIEDA